MNLFDFYSRKFEQGELVAVFKNANRLIGYGVLIAQVAHTSSQTNKQVSKNLLSDWSSGLENSAWTTYINNELVIVNEFDMEKLECQQDN